MKKHTPLINNTWDDSQCDPLNYVFFKNMEPFYNRLKQVKNKEGVCWSCGVSHKDKKYIFDIVWWNVNKDLTSLGHPLQDLNETINLCVECAFHYMAEYNLAHNKSTEEIAIFNAAEITFKRFGYISNRLPNTVWEKLLNPPS